MTSAEEGPRKECFAGPDGPFAVPEHWPYSHAVKVGDLLFFSGQVAWDDQMRIVSAWDAPGQARQVWKNVRTIVENAGGKLTDVVSVTTYMDDVSLLEQFHSVRPEFFPDGDFPATTDVIAAKPSLPGFLLEMQGVAVIGAT